MEKFDIKNTTGVFIYDSNGNLRAASVATALVASLTSLTDSATQNARRNGSTS